MKSMILMTGAAVASAAPALAQVAPATGASAWAAFQTFCDDTPQYVETIVSHERRGRATSDATYRFTWMNPSDAKIDILSGPKKGSAISWTGGSDVKAHDGTYPGIVVPLDRMDGAVTDLRGHPIGGAAFVALRALWAAGGPLAEAPGPQLDGMPTTIVRMSPDPAKSHGVSEADLYVAPSGMPLRIVIFEGATLVEQDDFKDQNLSPNLSAKDFDL